jgi:hypothetical protein
MGFVDTFHSVATLAFIVGSALVGLRLLVLSARTRRAPEFLLGNAILLTAVLGYGLLIACWIVRGAASTTSPDGATPLSMFLFGAGQIFHDLGVTFFLLFVVHTFRRGDRRAWAFAGLLLALLWGGLAVNIAKGHLRSDPVGSASWFAEHGVIWGYALWNVVESYRYWLMMRRRSRVGIVEPMVTNRFFLWGTSSVCTCLAVWIASLPYLYMSDPARLDAITPAVRVATALVGLVSVSCALLAFVPPAWYRRLIVAGAPQAAESV